MFSTNNETKGKRKGMKGRWLVMETNFSSIREKWTRGKTKEKRGKGMEGY